MNAADLQALMIAIAVVACIVLAAVVGTVLAHDFTRR